MSGSCGRFFMQCGETLSSPAATATCPHTATTTEAATAAAGTACVH